MDYPSNLLEKLIDKFTSLPGIGKKSALRIVLNLLKQDANQIDELGNLIKDINTKIKYCEKCNNLSDHNVCSICTDQNRSQETICVVEDLRDVIAIENTSQYHGVYYVLNGLISPLEGVGPEDINIQKLIERLENENIDEVIFALSTTMEGDTTMFYISKQMKNNIKISTIARGISIGGELEYADEITLGRSIKNRIPYNNNQ
jgi:recombination protein RecR